MFSRTRVDPLWLEARVLALRLRPLDYRAGVTWQASSSAVRAFVADRDWAQFHSAENLAKSVAIEAGELLECFQWSPTGDPAEVRRELADVLVYCLLLADRIDADVDDLIEAKLEENARKYPVDRARGSSVKYDRL